MLNSLELLESEMHKKLNGTDNRDVHLNLWHVKYNHTIWKNQPSFQTDFNVGGFFNFMWSSFNYKCCPIIGTYWSGTYIFYIVQACVPDAYVSLEHFFLSS